MNIIKKKFAYLFAMGVFVLGISSSIPVFAASSSNSIIHKREYMTLWVKTDGGNLNVREDASLSAKIVGKLIDIKKKDAISVNTETLPVKMFSNIIMHTLIRE